VLVAEGIGVFGGTFDPIHIGHLVTAVNVRHALDLERVLLVVANDPWQKADHQVTPAADRLAMVAAAVGDVAGIEPCDLEIRRGGASYTADTLADLAAARPGASLHLVLGSDAAGGLETWERFDEVRARSELVVVTRPGSEEVRPPAGWAYRTVEVPRLDVSSTDLRARVAEGRPLDWLVTDEVIQVIAERRLYRQEATRGPGGP
jgi:nicotinate-nucleotide adenylyltransferase